MRWSARLLSAAGQPRKPRKPALSLEHFLQRQRALSLWREIVRATNKIPKSSAREEMRSFARHEFRRNKDVTDLTGKTEFDAMRRYIDELAA
ncbi:hypothetical protein AJ79_02873 [Helicocarpus griseus UAMH5409]|uniref:Complex 1 LYR protein domain-containing protein n=1 Tax=Helicocarpus griseus UAMH5409 TaxID=1447875 RepID=A0A2B7Y1W6_9EURO|nr:hypothetical protein AJ79_02873 [Helicocarpus griseus UAMH5409]